MTPLWGPKFGRNRSDRRCREHLERADLTKIAPAEHRSTSQWVRLKSDRPPIGAPRDSNGRCQAVRNRHRDRWRRRRRCGGREARDAGARVIALEKSSEPGGAAIISGGGCLVVGSPLQQQNGIQDTPDLAFKDWIEWGGPSADAVWARYYIEHTLHDLYHWAERLSVRWVDLKAQEGNSVLRWTRPERNGLGLMTHLIESFRTKGGEIIPETEITALRLEGGRVTGLEGCNAKTGEPVAVSSKAVVVATGGFNSNLEMVLEFKPALGNHKAGAARREPGTNSFVRWAAISRTWTRSGSTSTPRQTTATPRSAAASCFVWCPATSGSISRAAGFTMRRYRAATPRLPR